MGPQALPLLRGSEPRGEDLGRWVKRKQFSGARGVKRRLECWAGAESFILDLAQEYN